jgi:hypothetical protein
VDTAEKVIEALEAKNLSFTPKKVQRVVEHHGLRAGKSLENFTKEVVAEGIRRGLGVLKDFSDAFKASLPLDQIEELFWEGGWVYVRGLTPLEVHTRRANGSTIDVLRPTVSAPSFELPKEMELHVWPGLVKLRLGSRFQAVRKRAFLKAYGEEELRKISEDIERLVPFLPAMGLEDLPQALERLRALDMWESRIEDSYVLARGGGLWTLRKGPIFGDPELDGALLREEEIGLSFPGDVEIAFRIAWYLEWDGVGFQDFRIRWGREVVYLGADLDEWEGEVAGLLADPIEKNPVAEAIRARLEREVYFYELEEKWSRALTDASPRMHALVRVLAQQEDPLAFLAEGKLSPYVTAELFGDL